MSAALKQQLAAAADKFNERPIRERALMVATIFFGLMFVGWELFVTPRLTSGEQQASQLAALSQTEQALLDQQQALDARLSSDPSRELREQLAAREARLERIDQELADTTGQLIAPKAMVALLRDMLMAQKGLELLAVELFEPVPIFDESRVEETATDAAQRGGSGEQREPLLYAHEVELAIRGGYLDVLSYLEGLEALDDRLGWISLDYRIEEYPDNEVRIRVRTLSLDRAWLGV